jgi:putative hydrolase of the HAD superfamily
MIKAVLFDIDNVLYDTTSQVMLARRNAVEAMIEAGLGMSVEEATEKLEAVVKRHGPNFDRHFDVLIGESREKARIVAAGVVAYHNTKIAHLKPYPDTVSTLLKLKNSGYKIGVITDGLAIKQWEKLIRLGLQHFFDAVVVSQEVGFEKPDVRVYEAAYKKLGVEPGECLYVGDRLDTDITGANRAGMQSVRIMRGRYKDQAPKGLQERPGFEIQRMEELLRILKEW